MNQIVKLPHMSEKSLSLAARGWYTFSVAAAARKENIVKSIHSLYGVDVVDIRTVHMHGKVRRVGRTGRAVRKPDWKKALVKLAPGQKIDAFEVASQVKK